MTRYAALTRRQAAVVALLFVVVTGWLFRGATRDVAGQATGAPAASGHRDVDLFRSVVEPSQRLLGSAIWRAR